MSFLGLFSGKDKSTIVNGAVDLVTNVRSMIDDSKFTTEEAARANIAIADKLTEFVGNTLDENTERSITRRKIAVFYMYYFCSYVTGVGIIWKFDEGWAEFLMELLLTLHLGSAFIAVIAFFFGGHYLRLFQVKSKKK